MPLPKKRSIDQLGEPDIVYRAKISRTQSNGTTADYRPAGKLQKLRDEVPQGLKISRKSLRKEMRQMKKARRHAYHSKGVRVLIVAI